MESDYGDMEDFNDEQLYVVDGEKEGNENFEGVGDDDYGYQSFDDVHVEPLLVNPALRSIGWMCGDPMPDYAHVVFSSIR